VRVGRGEIDLLMRIDGIVVAAEVKTRYGADPLLQMTEEKERRMLDAAGRVRPRPARIDVLSVEFGTSGATVRWIRGLS
jgi:Holliday junction resolvase-like predicted endonuclease